MSQEAAKKNSSARKMSSSVHDVPVIEKPSDLSNINELPMKQNTSAVSEEQQVTLFSELNGYKENLVVKVRILHLWFMRDNADPNKLFAIEMIWMDEDGTKLQARVMNRFTEKYRNVLKSDKTYYIKNLGSVLSKGIFMPTEKTDKLSFQYDTSVTECHDFKGSLHGFNFVGCETIFAGDIEPSQSIDFIAEVVDIGMLKEDNADRARHYLKLMLQDLKGIQINSCLWGDNAHKMHDFAQSQKDDTRIILIIQFARVSWFGGVVSVESYYQTSRTFINDDVAEIDEFRKRLAPRVTLQTTSATSGSSLRSIQSVSEEADFLENNSYKYIGDITLEQPCTFVIIGTIIFIPQNKPWYFLSCSGCMKAVVEKADQSTRDASDRPFTYNGIIYECINAKCRAPARYVNPRFKIPVKVKDDTAEVNLTLFDGPAVKLLKESCKTVINKTLNKGLTLEYFPSEVKNLLKKRCVSRFILHHNIQTGTDYFGVSRITEDQEIMAKLETGFADDQEDNYESGNVVSHTDENVTPTSPVQLGFDVREDDTVEEVEGFSANKKLRTSNEDKQKKELIKVKLEK